VKCRFGYPRFPSNETIIAQPLPADIPIDDKKEIYKKYKGILSRVKTVLESDQMVKTWSVHELCEHSDVGYEEYQEALSISEKGQVVILKRSVCDIYVNNYNSEWLRSWNANMDIQICLDLFAIITYITDYYGKDESGLTQIVNEAWKSSEGKPTRDRLYNMKNVFLSHRQMGLSEAFYRLIASLRLRDSNITCLFVASGFPSHRTKFLYQVNIFSL
jgi:hypothetical protein